MCGYDNNFEWTTECSSGEWCTGPSNMTNAVLGSSQLCKKGIRNKSTYRSRFCNLFDPPSSLKVKYYYAFISLAITNCGGSQLAPGCSYCPMSDDVFFNTWCSGNCEFDQTEGTCTEIKGKSKRFSFLAYLIKIILDHKRQYSSQHHFN